MIQNLAIPGIELESPHQYRGALPLGHQLVPSGVWIPYSSNFFFSETKIVLFPVRRARDIFPSMRAGVAISLRPCLNGLLMLTDRVFLYPVGTDRSGHLTVLQSEYLSTRGLCVGGLYWPAWQMSSPSTSLVIFIRLKRLTLAITNAL